MKRLRAGVFSVPTVRRWVIAFGVASPFYIILHLGKQILPFGCNESFIKKKSVILCR